MATLTLQDVEKQFQEIFEIRGHQVVITEPHKPWTEQDNSDACAILGDKDGVKVIGNEQAA